MSHSVCSCPYSQFGQTVGSKNKPPGDEDYYSYSFLRNLHWFWYWFFISSFPFSSLLCLRSSRLQSLGPSRLAVLGYKTAFTYICGGLTYLLPFARVPTKSEWECIFESIQSSLYCSSSTEWFCFGLLTGGGWMAEPQGRSTVEVESRSVDVLIEYLGNK